MVIHARIEQSFLFQRKQAIPGLYFLFYFYFVLCSHLWKTFH